MHLKSIFIFAMAWLGTLLLLKSAFEKWLEDENFDEYQQQRKRLEVIRESLQAVIEWELRAGFLPSQKQHDWRPPLVMAGGRSQRWLLWLWF